MEQATKQRAIENLITTMAEKIDGITSEQVESALILYSDDERNITEIEKEIQAYYASIETINSKMSMQKKLREEPYQLDIDSPIKGIYLGTSQIDLMAITEVSSTNELLEFIANCAQIKYSEIQLQELYKMKLEQAKRKVFADYRNSLVGPADLEKDPNVNLRRKIKSLGLSDEVAEEVITLYKAGKSEQAINYITTRLNLDYGTILSQNFKRYTFDYDDIKCSSYEEIAALAKKYLNLIV